MARRVTEGEKERMRVLREQGLSYEDIAEAIGCGTMTVYRWVNPDSIERHDAKRSEWIKAHKAEHDRLKAAWRANHPGYYADWRKSNPGKAAVLSAHNRADKKGLPFDPAIADDLGDPPDSCPVCGVKMAKHCGSGEGAHPYPDSPSIDRIIPELGYVPGNVQWLCQGCNLVKKDRPMEYLLARRAA